MLHAIHVHAPARRAGLPLALCAAGLLGLAGCAAKAPTGQLARTEKAMREADRGGGPQYAPLEMHLAQQKADEAKAALKRKDHERARRLLEQAEADAELADAKASAAKARNNADEAKKTLDSLRTEVRRGVGR